MQTKKGDCHLELGFSIKMAEIKGSCPYLRYMACCMYAGMSFHTVTLYISSQTLALNAAVKLWGLHK